MINLPTPLTEAPPPHSFAQDLRILAATELRLTWNKLRQWPLLTWLLFLLPSLGFLALLVFLGKVAYTAMVSVPAQAFQGILSLVFMGGVIGNIFFGVTASFVTLYMSDDLELLFVAPVSTRAIFTVKILKVSLSNFFSTFILIFLPGLFLGLLQKAPFLYYLWLIIITLALQALGTAIASLVNLAVMRIVPPHRSKEAVGFIGALSGIVIALFFQIPNILVQSGNFELANWVSNQGQLLKIMNWFPWGWGSLALFKGATGSHLQALLWSLLTVVLAVAVSIPSFLLVERGFRRGWISLSQGEGARKKTKVRKAKAVPQDQTSEDIWQPHALASPARGMWAIAKKDLLSLRRDTREWFGYIAPLLVLAFFVGRVLLLPGAGAKESLIGIFVMYTIMFSGNSALQSFGREGESEWILNSVPLAGWPVVWGKLMAAVIPSLILMELMLTGTTIALGFAPGIIIGVALATVLLSLGSSAIGLFYSITNSRYNPDNPQQKISAGGALLMFLVNGLFIALLALCLLCTFPPNPLIDYIRQFPPVPFTWGFPDTIIWLLYTLSRPFTWTPVLRIAFGLLITLALWSAVFFGFMWATVHQSRKGFRVELATTKRGRSSNLYKTFPRIVGKK